MKHVPNILTGIRLLIIPVLGYYIYMENYIPAGVLLVLAGLTDVLDGRIARKYQIVSTLGKVGDPIADKLLQFTCTLMLYANRTIPIAIPMLTFGKELLMAIGGLALYKKKNIVKSSSWYGKFATLIFYTAILFAVVLSIVNQEAESTRILVTYAMYIALGATLFAFFMYFKDYRIYRKIK